MRRTPTPLSILGCAALALGAPNASTQCVFFIQLQLDSFDLGALTCPADLDLDCAVGVSNVTTFLDGFAAELPWADPAPPLGVHDFRDVMAFLSDFTLACP